MFHLSTFYEKMKKKRISASAGNRTRINCFEGSYADHYTTDALCARLLYIDMMPYKALKFITIVCLVMFSSLLGNFLPSLNHNDSVAQW